MLRSYLKKIYEIIQRGDAREETYYSTLEKLLQEYSESINKKDIKITTLPRQTEAGNPDFRVWDGKQHIVGYIEAKKPGSNLDDIEISEQLKRYNSTFPNLILTNFTEFRLYRDGRLMDKISLCRPFIIYQLDTIPSLENKEQFLKLLESFFSFSLPKIYNAKTLAVELAKRTRFLKNEVIEEELREEENNKQGFILGFYEAFQEYLIKGLSQKDFADLYSQTITYGLFAARTRSIGEFNRKLAYDNIPQTIGILREVFEFISIGNLPIQMEWTIDDISEVLAVTDVKKILLQYYHKGKGKDPVIHFYETFLAEYDPRTREGRGVYYTPEPVVSYIVRSLNSILKEHFNKTDGFADKSVTILDPAAGTLTFLAEAAKLAIKEFVSKYGEGARESFIKEQILQNFYAFELMMAPYAIGHLKMSFLLEELGYKLKEDERFKLYLTNTLEMGELAKTNLPGMASLSKESHLADKVKKEQPILVILGNPPYSGISSNKGEWIDDLLKKGYKRYDGSRDEGYYRIDGKPLGERNPKWLQDDYVKFIRFAQWKIDQAGEGVLGFITNHSYIDNPTFRGMRQSLMNTFNEIYILDLHGNNLKREKCPDGSKDQNVFDIQQGVAIALFIKKKNNQKIKNLYHSDLWGLRKAKYNWLLQNDIKTTKWEKISPKSEHYFFIPTDDSFLENYQKYFKITVIFPLNNVGITTSRDHFVIDTDKRLLENRIRLFKNSKYSDDDLHTFFQINKKKGWNIRKSWDMLQSIPDSGLNKFIKPILYRPFDIRWIFYHDSVIERSRKEVMQNMMKGNLGLISTRFVFKKEIGFHHAFVTKNILDINQIQSPGTAQLFPLYLHLEKEKQELFNNKYDSKDRKLNINSCIIEILTRQYKKEFIPEEIFYYIYTVLYSNLYREKYAEFLKIDFPRIPFTKNYDLFRKMGKFGKRLVNLHLLKSTELEHPLCKFQGQGDNRVEKIKYDEKEKRIYFSEEQYFEEVPQEIWQYQIGGYQVCRKWLKDRKGRCLSLEDIKHYCKMVTALQKTIEIQQEIDNLYEEVEKDIIES